MDLSRFKKLFIGGMELKQLFIGNKFENKVPTSIDTDKSIYQGKGYIEGYRLSSSGALSSQANTVTTGYIPYKNGDVIRMSGVEWLPTATGTYTYLAFYDASFSLLGSINCQKNANSLTGYVGVGRGIVQFKNTPDSGSSSPEIPTQENGVIIMDQFRFISDADKVAWFRINGYGSGADMKVSVNEDMTMHQVWKAGYKNWVKYSTEADGVTIYNGGLGYKDGYRVRSGGAETENASSSITGYIKVEPGDVIRFPADHWVKSTGSAINTFNHNGSNCGQICGDTSNYGYFGSYWKDYGYATVTKKGDYYEWIVPPDTESADGCNWIRITGAVADGSKLIVTINEEID